jgi:hypothetical protein
MRRFPLLIVLPLLLATSVVPVVVAHVQGLPAGDPRAYLAVFAAYFLLFATVVAAAGGSADERVHTIALPVKPSAWLLRAWGGGLGLGLAMLAVASVFPAIHLEFSPLAQVEAEAARFTPEELSKIRENVDDVSPLLAFAAQFVQSALAGTVMNGVLSLPHELAFRGLLWTRLGHVRLPVRIAATSVASALWLLPMESLGVLHSGLSLPTALTIGGAVALAEGPVLAWVRLQTGSAVGSALARGAFWAVGLMVAEYALPRNRLWIGPSSVAGLLCLVAAGLFVRTRRESRPHVA